MKNRNVRSIGATVLACAAVVVAGSTVAQAGGKPRPAPLVPVLVAPAQGAYAAPAPTYGYYPYAAGAYSAPIGNAPAAVAGSRIKAVDRSDLIEDIQNSAAKDGKSGPKSERRKALRDSVSEKYATAVGSEVENLNEYERADIDNIVNSIIDGQTAATGATVGTAVGLMPTGGHHHHQQYQPVLFGVGSAPTAPVAPVYAAPLQAPTQYVQPMVPVQVWVPNQPKHWLFRRH